MDKTLKTYSTPAVIEEVELETRAGSPLSVIPGWDEEP